jgi:hypothetical protein
MKIESRVRFPYLTAIKCGKLRGGFDMKKRLILAAVLAILLITAACTGNNVPNDADGFDNIASDISGVNARLGFMVQEYIGDNIAEIPYIEYRDAQSESIDAINRSLNQGIRQTYDDFMRENADSEYPMWIEIKSYPFAGDRFLQAVVTHNEYPTYGTDGNMFSINYDKIDDIWVGFDWALHLEDLTYEALLSGVHEAFVPEVPSMYIDGIDLVGFKVHETNPLYIQYLLEIMVGNSEAEGWKSFYSYTPSTAVLYRMDKENMFE